MNSYAVDLHVHSSLSPCAEREMSPCAVAAAARDRGLAMIALCDHDGVGGAQWARRTAAELDVVVLDGVEITTSEQTHLLGILPGGDASLALARRLGLDVREPNGDGIGACSSANKVPEGRARRTPAPASNPSLPAAVHAIHRVGGLAIAAHVDRPSFGLLRQLGGVPSGLALDALEVSAAAATRAMLVALQRFSLPLVVGSDAHDLTEIGCAYSRIEMRWPCFDELVLALRGVGGRRCSVA